MRLAASGTSPTTPRGSSGRTPRDATRASGALNFAYPERPEVKGHIARLARDARFGVGPSQATRDVFGDNDELLDVLPSIHIPTLVVCGELDLDLRPTHARAIASRIPGAELGVVPDCGQIPQTEQPVLSAPPCWSGATEAAAEPEIRGSEWSGGSGLSLRGFCERPNVCDRANVLEDGDLDHDFVALAQARAGGRVLGDHVARHGAETDDEVAVHREAVGLQRRLGVALGEADDVGTGPIGGPVLTQYVTVSPRATVAPGSGDCR